MTKSFSMLYKNSKRKKRLLSDQRNILHDVTAVEVKLTNILDEITRFIKLN